jgi:hypothetical protein
VFDEAFFAGEFVERTREFSSEHEGLGLRVEFATSAGERFDVLEFATTHTGVRLVTRDELLIYLPYTHIAHVDVSLLRDYRVPSFALQV